MTRRQALTLGGVGLIALILAFPLQDVIRTVVVIPLAYVWWVLGVLYRSIPQVAVWILLILLIALMLMGSFANERKRRPLEDPEVKVAAGQVQGLAESLSKMRKSTYYKWKVANQLGRLARDLLVLRGERAGLKDFSPLSGHDWRPSASIDAYLESGLHGSFTDFPNGSWPLRGTAQSTPLDIEVEDVVRFLESQIRTK